MVWKYKDPQQEHKKHCLKKVAVTPLIYERVLRFVPEVWHIIYIIKQQELQAVIWLQFRQIFLVDFKNTVKILI